MSHPGVKFRGGRCGSTVADTILRRKVPCQRSTLFASYPRVNIRGGRNHAKVADYKDEEGTIPTLQTFCSHARKGKIPCC